MSSRRTSLREQFGHNPPTLLTAMLARRGGKVNPTGLVPPSRFVIP